jgi:hypothetical protein
MAKPNKQGPAFRLGLISTVPIALSRCDRLVNATAAGPQKGGIVYWQAAAGT